MIGEVIKFNGPELRKMREERIDKNTGRPWSQSILAFALREEGTPVSAQQVARWEKAIDDPDRAEPQGRFLISLSKIFDKKVEDFYTSVKKD